MNKINFQISEALSNLQTASSTCESILSCGNGWNDTIGLSFNKYNIDVRLKLTQATYVVSSIADAENILDSLNPTKIDNELNNIEKEISSL